VKIPASILAASILALFVTSSLVSGGSPRAKDEDIIRLQGDVVKLQQTVQTLQTSLDEKNATVMARMDKIADQVNILADGMKKIADLLGTLHTDTAAAAASAAKSAGDTREALMPTLNEIKKGMGDLNETASGLRLQMKSLSEQVVALKTSNEPAAPGCKQIKQNADSSRFSAYYDDAISSYRDFLSNPKCMGDSQAAEVQFNIADIYYEQKKWEQAITDYDIFLKNYPGHDKTASALLRKGSAQAELKQTAEARETLTRVSKEFKGTSEAAAADAKLKTLSPAATGNRGNRGN
jgi:TolA-binding protein